MELWIRSQNKRMLTKLDYCYLEPVHKREILGGNHYLINQSLGIYPTEKRALKILDEIQNIIKPTLINTEYHSEIKQGIDKLSFDVVMQPIEDKITYIQTDVVVYEMPKE